VIPGFNSMEMRFANFEKAVAADPCNRLAEVMKEVEFAFSHVESMLVISRLEKEGVLPLRITHNDTKLNNVLFDENDRAICVIDLDTVMPGLSLYDFGDTIRTAANTGHEDEEDLEKIHLDINIFSSFADGFIERTHQILSAPEIEHLPLSAQYMTFIMGIRFLTDYISGDVYYTTRYEKQNLRRCRAQFRLIEDMIARYNECQSIINNIIKKY
jgi:Ser/Thr protein kinase RdoA (MazF antagonist)